MQDPQYTILISVPLKIAEKVKLPIIVALTDFSQAIKSEERLIANDKDVQDFIGKLESEYHALDKEIRLL